MQNISYIRKKVPMSDFHFDGNDFTVMVFGAGFAIVDQLMSSPALFAGPLPMANKELLEVCIKAAVGAVVGLTVKALFECAVCWIKAKFTKKPK